jgi:hypothetical protein
MQIASECHFTRTGIQPSSLIVTENRDFNQIILLHIWNELKCIAAAIGALIGIAGS